MRRGPLQTLAASPTMVGAITTLIVIVAVFLAYNANQGLPFVPVYRVSVEVPNAARLVHQNEVRIGGHRVGAVESIEPIRVSESTVSEEAAEAPSEAGGFPSGDVLARLNLKLDRAVEPLPQDSLFRVRYRSSFGLKYLEITRGDGRAAPEGFTFPASQTIEQTEFDDINNTFDRATRANARTNLVGFGNGFAGRGLSLNEAIEALNPLLSNLKPVARTLTDPDTRLRRFFPELADAARIVAPVAAEQAELFTNMAIAFAAISEDEEALKDTISEGVPTLETGIRTLPRQRPFLRDFTTLSRLLRPGVRELRVALPTLNEAIETGTPVLRRTPPINRKLRAVLRELKQLVEQPSTKVTLQRLKELFDEADPLARHVVPAQTVCNYWSYWFTLLPEHLTDRDQVGYNQRVSIIGYPGAGSRIGTPLPPPLDKVFTPGEARTSLQGYSGLQANGKAGAEIDPPQGGEFRPYEIPIVHGSPYAPSGQPGPEFPDCQTGQSGYALGELRIPGQPADNPAFAPSDIPGSLGPTTVFFTQDGERRLVDTRISGRFPNP